MTTAAEKTNSGGMQLFPGGNIENKIATSISEPGYALNPELKLSFPRDSYAIVFGYSYGKGGGRLFADQGEGSTVETTYQSYRAGLVDASGSQFYLGYGTTKFEGGSSSHSTLDIGRKIYFLNGNWRPFDNDFVLDAGFGFHQGISFNGFDSYVSRINLGALAYLNLSYIEKVEKYIVGSGAYSK